MSPLFSLPTFWRTRKYSLCAEVMYFICLLILNSLPFVTTSLRASANVLRWLRALMWALYMIKKLIGGHLVRYPWSAISDWAVYQKISDWRESGVRHYIRYQINFYPISDIPPFINQHSNWGVMCSPVKTRVLGLNPVGMKRYFFWYWILEWTLKSISEFFRYCSDGFQSDYFLPISQ